MSVGSWPEIAPTGAARGSPLQKADPGISCISGGNRPETSSHRSYLIQFVLACCSKKEAPLGTSGKIISYSLQRTRPVDLPRIISYMYALGI